MIVSPSQKINLTSTGQLMDGGIQFQLGGFKGGFVPTAGNASHWAGHWASPAGASAPCDTNTKAFDLSISVDGNVAPYAIGTKAYVWGRRASGVSDAWILFRTTWVAIPGQCYLQISIHRLRNRLANLTAEVSTELQP